MIYGYARVSTRGQATDGNSLQYQEEILKLEGAEKIYKDVYSGAKIERRALQELLSTVKEGDTVIVTKLDRLARSITDGLAIINSLIEKGVRIKILNIGVIDQSPTGKLILNIFFSFAEFERDLIRQRTQEGKEIAKKIKPDYKEGRPKRVFTPQQTQLILLMIEQGQSINSISKTLSIPYSSLKRYIDTLKLEGRI